MISQNVIYGYVIRSSSAGESIVAHYYPQYIWIVDNLVMSSHQGIVSTGADGYFVIGNAILSIRHPAGDSSYDPRNIYKAAGVLTYNTTNSYHVNNTIWGSDSGIGYGGNYRTEIVNNLIGRLTEASHHIGFDSSGAVGTSLVSHNFLAQTPRVRVSVRYRAARACQCV